MRCWSGSLIRRTQSAGLLKADGLLSLLKRALNGRFADALKEHVHDSGLVDDRIDDLLALEQAMRQVEPLPLRASTST
jgi:hypothetical protein